MLICTTFIQELYFASQFTAIGYETDTDWVEVTLATPTKVLLQERYYPCDGKVSVQALPSLFLDYMEGERVTYISVSITAVSAKGETVKGGTAVLYCPFNVSRSGRSFVRSNFLTTSTARLMLRHQQALDFLTFFVPRAESVQQTFLVTVRKNDQSYETLTINVKNTASAVTGLVRLTVRYSDVLMMAMQQMKVPFTMVSATVSVGSRSFTYYFTDRLCNNLFLYKNAFGCDELVMFDGVTKEEVSTAQSEASLQEEARLYNRTHNLLFSVESAPLTLEMAKALEQLCLSYEAHRLSSFEDVAEEGNWQTLPILVTDYKAEISDGANPTRFSFSYRLVSHRPFLSLESTAQECFSPEFNPSFD